MPCWRNLVDMSVVVAMGIAAVLFWQGIAAA